MREILIARLRYLLAPRSGSSACLSNLTRFVNSTSLAPDDCKRNQPLAQDESILLIKVACNKAKFNLGHKGGTGVVTIGKRNDSNEEPTIFSS